MWGILKIFRTYFMFGVSSKKSIKYTEKRAFQFILGMPLKKNSSRKSLGEWLSHNFNTILYKAHGIIIPQNINLKKKFSWVFQEKCYEGFSDILSHLHIIQYLTDFELINVPKAIIGASLIDQLVKNLPAVWENLVRFLCWEDTLKKGWATQSSKLGLPLWLRW